MDNDHEEEGEECKQYCMFFFSEEKPLVLLQIICVMVVLFPEKRQQMIPGATDRSGDVGAEHGIQNGSGLQMTD